jgi:hypothetical protein
VTGKDIRAVAVRMRESSERLQMKGGKGVGVRWLAVEGSGLLMGSRIECSWQMDE